MKAHLLQLDASSLKPRLVRSDKKTENIKRMIMRIMVVVVVDYFDFKLVIGLMICSMICSMMIVIVVIVIFNSSHSLLVRCQVENMGDP